MIKDLNKSFCANIMRAMCGAGVEHSDIVEAMNADRRISGKAPVNPQHVSDMKMGYRDPSFEFLIVVSRLCGVTIDELVG